MHGAANRLEIKLTVNCNLNYNSKIQFFELLFSKEPNSKKLYSIVRKGTDCSIEVEKTVCDLIKELQKNISIDEASKMTLPR